jgi:RimJ/RimL family protein N-acetyltransferase
MEKLFEKSFKDLGVITFRAFQIEEDSIIIHKWVNMTYAIYWGMMGTTLEEFKSAYSKTLASGTEVYIGEIDGKVKVLMEKYNVIEYLKNYYNGSQGDIGMHILIGPSTQTIHRFTWNVFSSVMEFLFIDVSIDRVIVEPDIRNEKIHILNKKAGFEYQKQIQLPHKKAWLATCTRKQFKEVIKLNS